jgi:membrane protease YdiL (CAAX protease family)
MSKVIAMTYLVVLVDTFLFSLHSFERGDTNLHSHFAIAATNTTSPEKDRKTLLKNMKRVLQVLMALAVFSPISSFHVGSSPFMRVDSSAALHSRNNPLRYRNRDEGADAFVTSGSKKTPTSKQVERSTGAHLTTIHSIATSQALALFGVTAATAIALAASGHPVDLSSIHWNGSTEFYSLWDFHLTTTRAIEGLIATVPLVYLGTLVERSDHRDVSHCTFSTMNMVMTLFGRRKHEHKDGAAPQTPETPMMHALVLSTALAMVTGVSEEIVFRGILPSVIINFAQSVPITLFGQAFLFGFGHLSPQSSSSGENKVVVGLQTTNGLWYGLVYLATGGDILPCIIAHALYDIHVFVETWMKINDQIDYTESSVLQMLHPDDEVEIRRIKQEAGPSLSTETLAHARRFFYAFDYEHRGSLSESDVKRAVSYAFLQGKVQPDEDRVADLFKRMLQERDGEFVDTSLQDRLRLSEFFKLLFLLKARAQPV